MRRKLVVAIVDPLDELMAWIYEGIHECIEPVWSWALDVGGVRPPDTSIVAPVHEGMTVLVFASYAVLVVVGGLIVMAHETIQTQHSVKEVLPRLVVGLGLAWASPLILDGAVAITSDVVSALIDLDEGELSHSSFQPGVDPKSLLGAMYRLSAMTGLTEMSFMALLSVVLLLVGAFVLLISAVMRWLAMLGVVALAPLALACHGLPQTEGAAKLWWRMLIACMASSIGQAGCLFLWRYIAWDANGEPRTEVDHFKNGGTDGYFLSVVYMLITVWSMWKVHTEAFRWARGRPLRIPGARMVAGMVAWRTMDKLGAGRKRRHGRRGASESASSEPGVSGAAGVASKFRWSGFGGAKDRRARAVRVRRPEVHQKAWAKATEKPKALQPRARIATGPVKGRGQKRAHLPVLPSSRINPASTTPTPQHGANLAPTPMETTGAGPGTPVPRRIIGPLRGPDAKQFSKAVKRTTAYRSTRRTTQRRGDRS